MRLSWSRSRRATRNRPLDEDEEDQSQEHVGVQFDDEPKVLQFDDEPKVLQFDDEPKVLQFDDEPLTAGAVEKLPPIDDEPPADDKTSKSLLKFADEIEPDNEPGTAADDEPSPDDVQKPLEQAKDLLDRARLVSDPRKDGLKFDDEPLTAGAVEKLPPIDDEPPADDKPRKDGLKFDDEPLAAGAVEELPDDPDDYPDQEELPDDPDEELPPPDVQNSLEEAESLVNRSRLVSNPLFKEARRMPEYGRVLATRERCAQFERKLLRTARMIDSRLGTKLPADTLDKVVERLANRFAAWEHSHDRQKVRQRMQALKRRRHNRGRDLQIVRYIENGESQRKVADRLGTTRWVVQHVLKRDAQHLLKRNKPPKPPD